MNDDVTACAATIARTLAQRDTDLNELAKVATYLRTHLDGAQFFRLLDTMVKNGQHLARTGRTLDYYRDIQDVCQQHLGPYRNAKEKKAEEMAQILGWAVRLMRYYKRVGVSPSQQPSTQILASSVPSAVSAKNTPQQGRQRPPLSQQVVVKTERELVTLIENARGGKAQVQTKDGAHIACAGFPYIGAMQGKRCRADVTRQGGKVLRATFKGWA
jgi:hypothetical protein